MTEHSPEHEPRTKFASPRDAVLHQLTLIGWGSAEPSGNVASPSGWFCKISNGATELDDLADALGEPFSAYGLADTAELVGHFLVVEDNVGFVEVEVYEDEGQLDRAYDKREDTYREWEQEGE